MVDSVQTQGEKFCWLFPKVVLNQTVKVNPPYLEKVFLFFFGIVVLALLMLCLIRLFLSFFPMFLSVPFWMNGAK